MPPPREDNAVIGVRCPSVCLSDVAYIGSNSKTKRPRKMKLCTGVPQVTCDSHTDFKVKRSKVKVTRRWHIVASTKRAATWRTAADITSLKYYLILQCLLTHSLTAALDQLRVVASSTSNDPGPRSRQHQQIGQRYNNTE